MASGAIAQLMGYITSPVYKQESSLLKFRLAFTRYDFSAKKSVVEFVTVTSFGRAAEKIYSEIQNDMNYICCFCDVRVSNYPGKNKQPVEHVEFIVSDFRTFRKEKTGAQHTDTDDAAPANFPF